MRILHVQDEAGVASVMAKYQRLQGDDSRVIKISRIDKYCINHLKITCSSVKNLQ